MKLTSERGTSILEATVATCVLLVAATGMLGVHTQQVRQNADARRITEATALAQDLVENIALWSFTDPRLSNVNKGNDADIGDVAQQFETDPPPYDHAEADLALGTWNGLPARPGFERYWNVAYVDDYDKNGVWDAVRIAVIVRWRSGAAWRRVVLLTTKSNPAEVQ